MQLLHFVRSYGMLYTVKCSGIVSDVACAGGVSPVRLTPSKSAPTAGIAALSYNRISSVVLPCPAGALLLLVHSSVGSLFLLCLVAMCLKPCTYAFHCRCPAAGRLCP